MNHTPHRFLLSRTDSIGDVMLTLPMAGLLKRQFSSCEVLFLCKKYTRSVVECCTDVDNVIDADDLLQLPEAQQIEYLQGLQVDCIVHVFPNKKVAKLAKAAHILLRIGTSHRIFHWTTCNRRVNLSRKNSPLHEAQLNFALLRPLGIGTGCTLEEVEKCLHLKPKAISLPAEACPDSAKFNLVLHPKSKGSAREWGVGNFAQLIDLLPSERFKIFVTGTAAEGEMLRPSLLAPYSGKITDLTGTLSLDELVALLAKADGLVAASTGPLHIAAALGIHAIGLFPPILPMHPGRWAPVGRRVKVFVANKECEQCRKSAACACMQEITPMEVAEYLRRLL